MWFEIFGRIPEESWVPKNEFSGGMVKPNMYRASFKGQSCNVRIWLEALRYNFCDEQLALTLEMRLLDPIIWYWNLSFLLLTKLKGMMDLRNTRDGKDFPAPYHSYMPSWKAK